MSASVRWEGLDELRAQLRNLPAELTAEASHIVQGTANAAIVDMRAEYPAGELRDKLYQSTVGRGVYGVGILIKNSSGWAWHWDHGTALRHRSKSGGSTGAEWGGKTPPHTFARNMAQKRRLMYDQLKALLERTGLRVSGEA
jgi:hypothetical protein